MKKLSDGGVKKAEDALKTQAYSEKSENSRQTQQRTFIDVVRKGGKRRGYVTVRRTEDHKLEVGFSLCELKDKFKGELGLGIAFKRGHRLSGQNLTDRLNGYAVRNKEGLVCVIPHTLIPRLLSAVDFFEKSSNSDNLILPPWVRELRNLAPKIGSIRKQTHARKKGGG